MDEKRTSAQPRRHAAGPRDEAAQAHDDDGFVASYDAERLNERLREAKRRCHQSQESLPAHATDGQPLDRDAFRRNDARLETVFRSEPDDIKRLRAQQTCQRERREHVTAGAAGHDQDYGHSGPRPALRVPSPAKSLP